MTFMQIIDCRTTKFDDMNRLMDSWVEATQGKRTATHAVVGRDRSQTDHFVEIIEFPSYEEAMTNSALPETNRIFEEMIALCDGMPTFTDLDVVRDEQLNKATCRRFFQELAREGDAAAFAETFTADYHDHDVANTEQDTRGNDGIYEEVLSYRAGFPDFEFTIRDQIAEGDRVVTRWTWQGTQTGEMRGIPATGKKVTMEGTTTFLFDEHGKIKEGWWNEDVFGMLSQLGVVDLPKSA